MTVVEGPGQAPSGHPHGAGPGSEGTIAALRSAIESHIPGCTAAVSGGGGHFSIEVAAREFASLGTLASHKLVYAAIAHLMRGPEAPVHAIDSLRTRAPA